MIHPPPLCRTENIPDKRSFRREDGLLVFRIVRLSFRPEEPVEKVQYPCRTVGASVIFGDAVQFGECGQLVGELVFDEILPVVREGEEVVDVLFEILRIAVEEGVALLGGSCFVVRPGCQGRY